MYEMDDLKKHYRTQQNDFHHYIQHNLQFPDTRWQDIYYHAIEQRKNIASLSPHMIVCDVLYKSCNREILFEAANQLFGGYRIIVIESDSTIIKERLQSQTRTNHILIDPYTRYLSLQYDFEPFDKIDLNIDNNTDISHATNKVRDYIQ